MTEHDIIDVLRSGDPAPSDTTPGAETPLGRSILAAVMANATDPAGVSSRRPRRLIAIVIVAAALAGTAVAAWALNTRRVTNPVSVLCYDAPSTDASAIAAPRAATPNTEACAAFWDDGVLPINSDAPRGQVPPLVACVTGTGTLAVFPSDNTGLCTELGLADLAPPATRNDRVFELTKQLIEAINPETCLSLDHARQVTVDTFNELGLGDWTVRARPENSERPCSSLDIDATNRIITLVPIPKPDGP